MASQSLQLSQMACMSKLKTFTCKDIYSGPALAQATKAVALGLIGPKILSGPNKKAPAQEPNENPQISSSDFIKKLSPLLTLRLRPPFKNQESILQQSTTKKEVIVDSDEIELKPYEILRTTLPQTALPAVYAMHLTSSNLDSLSVFKTLFGETIEENATTFSLFSENNPFRRKPQENKTHEPQDESSLAVGEKDAEKERTTGNLNCSELTEKKKKKKDKEKKESLDFDLELSGESKKLKKDHSEGRKNSDINNLGENGSSDGLDVKMKRNSRLNLKGNLVEVNAHMMGYGKDGGSGIGNKNKKKKRKRDELELEYEACRYGEADKQEKENDVVGEKRKKMNNPEDMMVSKEGFDDENKLLRTVFVGNLPLKMKKKALLKEFAKFGDVESVRIRSVPIIDSKVPRKGAVIKKQINENADSVHAYVVFKTEDCAQASLSHNMAVVRGNHIRVDRACPPRKKLKGDSSPLYDNKRTIFVGNLPFDVKDEEIYQSFSGIKNLEASVEAVRVVRDPGTSLGKGIAYVLFKTRDAANSIVKKHNLKLRDRELRLSYAKSNSTPSKRKNISLPETYNTPAKKFAVDSRYSGSDNKVKAKANMSYQGMRASKAGTQKKAPARVKAPAKSKSGSSMEKPVKGKRPAVAARKLKAQRAANAPKQVGIKRKLDNRTPDTAGQKKKARKFR